MGQSSRHGIARVGLTARFDEGRVVLPRHERFGQISKELLEQPGDAVDVVEEVFWVSEVEIA
jgi:hypothetical protein